MNGVDVAVIAMLMFGVGGVAYSLGQRRRLVRAAAAAGPVPKREPPPPSAPKRLELEPEEDEEEEVPLTRPPPAVAAPPVPEPIVPVTHSGEDEEDVTKIGPSKPPKAEPVTAPPTAKARTIYHPPVQPIVFDEQAEPAADDEDSGERRFLVHATAQTDTGKRRKQNEDSLLVLERANLFVVADGMGGYKGGSLASGLVIKTMEEAAKSGKYEGPVHEEVPLEASELARAIQMANAEIQEEAKRQPDLEGMGTTVCAARFSPTNSRIYIGHVGDSRCYRMRAEKLVMMTRDHTMAEHGVKGPESLHLSRAVGVWPTVPIDIVMGVPKLGDVYLLCSDGLTKMLDDEVIAHVLRSEDDPRAAVDRLVLYANSRGGKDNITVVLVRVVPPNWKPRSPSGRDLTAEAMAAMGGFKLPPKSP